MDRQREVEVGSAWEKDSERKLRARLWLEIVTMVGSLSVFFGVAFGLIPTGKGDVWPLLVPFGCLVYMCQKMYREEEYPWRKHSSVAYGVLLIVAIGLIFYRDMNLPVNPL